MVVSESGLTSKKRGHQTGTRTKCIGNNDPDYNANANNDDDDDDEDDNNDNDNDDEDADYRLIGRLEYDSYVIRNSYISYHTY